MKVVAAGSWKQLQVGMQATFVMYRLFDAYAQGSWRFFVHRCHEPSDVGTLSCVFLSCLVSDFGTVEYSVLL
ncbi:hypothetical protein Nepgr_021647 [Nepenthes gracilis]|uniref:Uncharacterized protein n=1 Tax=Nepenthes gracilis TaxID=150966 RepID=A0AAD3T197_NEPGR|nr:hypothetical protein Nepgr_021647 [Nepenthes gracilis]